MNTEYWAIIPCFDGNIRHDFPKVPETGSPWVCTLCFTPVPEFFFEESREVQVQNPAIRTPA